MCINPDTDYLENLDAEIIRALADIYVSMHVIDLEADVQRTIKNKRQVAELLVRDTAVSKQMKIVMQNVCVDEFVEPMLSFTDIKTVAERIGKSLCISQEFEGKNEGWCRANFIVLSRNDKGLANKVLFTVEPIEEIKQRELELRTLSEMDALTRIANRRGGERQIAEMLQSGKPGMFCILDIDNFKDFNDKYGHQVGDEVLIKVAQCLKKTLRGEDCPMRLGGDEFAFYAVGIANENNARDCIQRIMNSIDGVRIANIDEKISISAGAVFSPAIETMTFDHLYNKADKKLYESKKQGGTCFEIIWGDI